MGIPAGLGRSELLGSGSFGSCILGPNRVIFGSGLLGVRSVRVKVSENRKKSVIFGSLRGRVSYFRFPSRSGQFRVKFKNFRSGKNRKFRVGSYG